MLYYLQMTNRRHFLQSLFAATGSIAGTVTSDYTGQTRPIVNANVTVCGGNSTCEPPYAYVVATGRTDSAGHYKVAFLRSGSYTVRFAHAGTFSYHCTIHVAEGMRGKIVVH